MRLRGLSPALLPLLALLAAGTTASAQSASDGSDLVIRAPDIGRNGPAVPPSTFRGDPYRNSPDYRPMPPEDDYVWHVAGLRPGTALSLRTGGGPNFRIIAELTEGTPVENLGCMDQNGGFWCRVATVGRPRISGWVNGRYLSDEAGGELRDRSTYYDPMTPYQETGPLPCRFRGDDRMLGCHFGINRDGPFAQIDITGPDGFTRSLNYRAGRFTTSDGSEVRSRKRGGAAEVMVGDETYLIPDDVMMDF